MMVYRTIKTFVISTLQQRLYHGNVDNVDNVDKQKRRDGCNFFYI